MALQYQMIPGIHSIWFLGLSPFFAYVVPPHRLPEGIRTIENISRFYQVDFPLDLDEILPWCGNV